MKSIILFDVTVLPGFIKKVRDMAIKAKKEGKTILEARDQIVRISDEMKISSKVKISNARVIKHEKGNSRWRMKKRALSLMIPY